MLNICVLRKPSLCVFKPLAPQSQLVNQHLVRNATMDRQEAKKRLANAAVYVGGSKLSKVVKALMPEGYSCASSRRRIQEAVYDQFNSDSTYGPIFQSMELPKVEGTDNFVWHFCNPFSLLCFLIKEAPAFRDNLMNIIVHQYLYSLSFIFHIHIFAIFV